MDMDTAQRLELLRDTQTSMRTLLGYTVRRAADESCPVCGAPLYTGTAVYEDDGGEVLGCAACINVRYV